MLRLRAKRSAASWKRLDSTPEATRPDRLQQLHILFGFTVTVVIWIVPPELFGYTATVIDRISPASMKNANHATIVNFLARNGVIDAKQVREITGDLISTNLYMSD